MELNAKELLTSDNKKTYKRWEKSIRTEEFNKSVSVEEAENGFIIIVDVSGKVKDSWEYKTVKFISDTNPLENLEASSEDSTDSKKKILDGITDFLSGLS